MATSVTRLQKAKAIAVYCVRLLALPVLLLVVAELALRVFLRIPVGLFCPLLPGPSGLYPPNQRMVLDFGVVPYVVESNSLGFRGLEITVQKPPGVFRIAALGDSITDGFFVDNNATFPYLLEQDLQRQGWRVQVLNAAHGGGTINLQFAMLQDHVLALDPDLVVLTWTPNDIGDLIAGRNEMPGSGFRSGPLSSLGWLACHSAILEGLLDARFRLASPNYRRLTRQMGQLILDDRRYQIPGNTNFTQNAHYTLAVPAETDGQIIKEPFTPRTEEVIREYLDWLNRMDRTLSARRVKFVFVYHPAYSQVYVVDSSMLMRNILRDECARLGIPFLDLTPVFQEKGKEKALDLAPLDYHLNPYGNQVVADALSSFLQSANLLPAK